MGFFDNINTELVNKCSSCIGRTNCKHPSLLNYKGSNDILLLFGVPTSYENETGHSFEGNVYDWYKEKIESIGVDYNACSKAHVTGCFSDNPRELNKFIKNCLNKTIEFIKEVKPNLIIAFGSKTLEITVAQDYTRDISNSIRWRGFLMPFKKYGFDTWLMTTFDFSEICLQDSFAGIIKRKEEKEHKIITTPKEIEEAVNFHSNYKIAHRLFLTDIRKAVIGYRKPVPKDPAETIPVHVLKDKDTVLKYLRGTYDYLKNNPNAILTIDTETNGLKPYNKDKRIYCVAMYANPDLGCFVFPTAFEYLNPEFCKEYARTGLYPHPDNDIYKELTHIAELNPRICGANYKFDMTWINICLGVKLEHIVWDTVVVAHLLDPRDGITSLKFQTYVNFGIAYEEGVHEFLESSKEDQKKYGSNALNRIFEAPFDEVAYYNGLDVVYTYSLMKEQYKQWKEFPNPNKWFAFKLFHKVIPVLAHMEMNGILIDKDKVEVGRKQCEEELQKIEERIKDDPVWIKWGELVGVEKRSILSDSQIIDVFINHMHLHPHGVSMNEKAKADFEWLSKLVDQEPFIANILEYRKYAKILHTYLDGLVRETNDDGRIRCNFTTNNVSSYRIASNSPNFQNISSRDEFQVELIKACFVPDEDSYYTSFDFSGLENCGSACITKDPYFTAVICDGRDMHKENALFMFCMSEEEFKALKKYDEENGTHYAKTARNGGKAASFSTLYGAQKGTIGNTLWKYMNEKQVRVTPTEFARDRVIRVLRMEEQYKLSKTKEDKEEFFLKCFIEHANEFLKDFWQVRGKVTYDWKTNNMNNYFKVGYAQYPVGLNIHGLFSSLTINNAVIQGSSSCCTLYSLILLDYLLKYFKINGFIINIIHDDINMIVKKSDIAKAMSLQKYVMEECTRKAFSWLTFNLSAECEISDTRWSDKKEYSEFIEYYEENKEKIGNAVEKALDGDWLFENWR